MRPLYRSLEGAGVEGVFPSEAVRLAERKLSATRNLSMKESLQRSTSLTVSTTWRCGCFAAISSAARNRSVLRVVASIHDQNLSDVKRIVFGQITWFSSGVRNPKILSSHLRSHFNRGILVTALTQPFNQNPLANLRLLHVL